MAQFRKGRNLKDLIFIQNKAIIFIASIRCPNQPTMQ